MKGMNKTPLQRFHVWCFERDGGSNRLFWTGLQWVANRAHAREYKSMNGARLGLRAATRLLDSLYPTPDFRERYHAEAVMFAWSDSWGTMRPVKEVRP